MDAFAGVIGHDKDGKPIKVGDRVAWGVKGHLRLGSVVELHHTYNGKVRKGATEREVRNHIRVSTLAEDTPRGRGGVFLETDLLVIPNK